MTVSPNVPQNESITGVSEACKSLSQIVHATKIINSDSRQMICSVCVCVVFNEFTTERVSSGSVR